MGQAATRGDVKITEASENIRYVSQEMAKEYLFLLKYPQRRDVKVRLKRILNTLSEDLRVIATTTKDRDTKDILEFLAYSKEQIEEIFQGEATKEKAALMLDYAETLLEGADSIGRAHMYDFSQEEKMLMLTKRIEYLLERVTKYYFSLHVGFNSTTNKEQMQVTMKKLEESFTKMGAYPYPESVKPIYEKMYFSWTKNKFFLDKYETLFIPKLQLMSTSYLENIVAKLSLYHSKNQ